MDLQTRLYIKVASKRTNSNERKDRKQRLYNALKLAGGIAAGSILAGTAFGAANGFVKGHIKAYYG